MFKSDQRIYAEQCASSWSSDNVDYFASQAGDAWGVYAVDKTLIRRSNSWYSDQYMTKLTDMTSYSFTKPLWNLASRGTANVFINPTRLSSSSIWLNTERGILRANSVQYQYHIIPH